MLDRRSARRDLIEFSRYTMPGYKPGWHHHAINDAVDRMLTGKLRRLIVSMPPRHGKSELISRRLPAFLLGQNPNETIIASSYSSDMASRMNRDIQRIMDSAEYKSLFPQTRLNESNARTIAGSWLRNSDLFEVVGHQGVYRSAGVGGGITGMGAKWLLIDDPIKNREEADSAIMRENIWDWYTSTLYTRQAPDARILIVMTRWHSDDLAGRLIAHAKDNPKADQWEVITFPAISGREKESGDIREEGEPLWPEMFGIEDLERMKLSMGEYQWSALYQQHPRSGGGTEWPDEYFAKDIWFDFWPKTIAIKTIGVDPSKGAGGKHGDYSAIVKLGRDTDGTLYCEADLARRSSEAIIDTVLETQGEFRADAIAFETNQFQELLATQLQQKAAVAGYAVPLVKVVNTVNKNIRIRRLGPYLSQKNIRFKANSPGTKLLVDQLRDFPVSEYDDGPDSLEMALRVMIEMYNGRKQRQPSRGVTT